MREIEVYDPGLDMVAGMKLLELALIQRLLQPNCKLGMQTKGWSSLKQSANAWRDPSISALDNAVVLATEGKYKHREYWLVFCDPGGSIDWHDHEQAEKALVYWPMTSPLPTGGGGYLEFDGEGPIVQPMQGQMILFSGTDRHRVQTYTGNGYRFSISCNLS